MHILVNHTESQCQWMSISMIQRGRSVGIITRLATHLQDLTSQVQLNYSVVKLRLKSYFVYPLITQGTTLTTVSSAEHVHTGIVKSIVSNY
jgi:hypothetical protein